MSARTYICVSCRWARRAEAAGGLRTDLRCPSCRGSLWELDRRWRIPRKENDKEWASLAVKVARDAEDWLPRRRQIGIAKIEKIDKKIGHFEQQRDSAKKEIALRQLRAERNRMQERYR